ncbi:hypothetical protein [Roseovarius sp.]|uniref:hypothetical protein n=1 Tax=Roseovarius sp. TaxID=1486281 RepID=UPI00260C6366|nr:hypothetical protein [Roseovarius sp.]
MRDNSIKSRTSLCVSNPCKIFLLSTAILVTISNPAFSEPSSEIRIEEGETSSVGEEITTNDITLENYGTIEVTGAGGKGAPKFAIFVPGDTDANNFTLNNYGLISADELFPLAFRTDGNSFIFNRSGGVITTGTSNLLGTVIDVSSGRLEVNNSGYIGSDEYERTTFHAFNGGTLIINNGPLGDIVSAGASEAAIDGYRYPDGDPGVPGFWGIIHVDNEGSIVAEGAAVSLAASSTIYNRGRIEGGDAAIIANDDNNEVTFGRGSVVIGDIEASAGTTGNKLIFDMGSSTSFIYQTNGPWELVDLNGRPVVFGSAISAGIGNVEVADELMFERSKNLQFSLARLADQQNSGSDDWLFDIYGSYTKRDEAGNTSRLEVESSGLNVGTTLDIFDYNAFAFFNYENSDADIGRGDQEISNKSWRVGLSVPEFWSANGFSMGGHALIGYNNYEGTRQVFVNQSTSTGVMPLDAEWDSVEFEVGASLAHVHQLSSKLSLLSSADLSAQVENIDSYAEGAHFAWDDRTIVQGHGKLSVALNYTPDDSSKLYAEVGAWHRNVWRGERADYNINGNSVSYSGGVLDDTISTLRLGAQYSISDQSAFSVEAAAVTSDHTDEGWGVSFGFRSRF